MKKKISILFFIAFSTVCFAQKQIKRAISKEKITLNVQEQPKSVLVRIISNKDKTTEGSIKESRFSKKTIAVKKQTQPNFIEAILIKNEKTSISSDNEKNPKVMSIKLERSLNSTQIKSKVILNKENND